MQSGPTDTKGDLRRAYVRVESGLTKRCQVLKESSNGEKVTVLIEDESHPTGVSSRHVWFEKSGYMWASGCEVCFLFGHLLQCRYCGRQFHELCCNMPEAKTFGAASSQSFTCRDCFFMLYASTKGMEKSGCSKNTIAFIKEVKLYRTYAYRELQWDSLHRFNRSGIYCYCGGPGHFCKEMLQCLRCLQWFHRACLHCLPTDRDVLPWDVFWFFKCAHCNGEFGEVCKQIPIVWVELLHLALMNLCLRRNDFCGVRNDIMPWLTENWRRILPENSISLAFETAETIEEKLKNDPARFQCAQEVGGDEFQWRPRCSLSGPLRPDLTKQCAVDEHISQADLEGITFVRQTAASSLRLLTLQSSAALPPPDRYQEIYGSRAGYRDSEDRLRASHLADYDESNMTLINEYRPDEDTTYGSAYRLSAAGSRRRRLTAAPRPQPPKPPRAKRRKLARKVRRRASSGERAKPAKALWEEEAVEELSPAVEFEEAGEESAVLDAEVQPSPPPESPEADENDRARSPELKPEPEPEPEPELKPVEKRKRGRPPSSLTKQRKAMKLEEMRQTRSKLKSELNNVYVSPHSTHDEKFQLDDEKIDIVVVNSDSLGASPKTLPPVVDDLPSKIVTPVNNVLTKTKHLSRDSSLDSPLTISSGGECDSRSETPSLRPRKKQVARKSVKMSNRTPSPPQSQHYPYPLSIRTRECSVALNNIHNWYEITGDLPPHSCASGSHVLRNIPSYTLASVDNNSTTPFAYRWEINTRPRVQRLKALTKWPIRNSGGSLKTRKRISLEPEPGIATIFARRHPMHKKQVVTSDSKLSAKDEAMLKVVPKGSVEKIELSCKTTVLPPLNMETSYSPKFEVLLNWNPKVLQMDFLA